MLFYDPAFFVFFGMYFCLHILTPPRYRLYLLIVGSTIFYGWWKPDYVWLPYLLSLIAWAGVQLIESAYSSEARRRRLIVTLVMLFAPLTIFKYVHFLVFDVVGALTAWPQHYLPEGEFQFALPLGISFVTFTLTAFVVNVYKGQFPSERLTVVLGYVLFFPHLIAGPILRPHELIPQLLKPKRALDARFTLGVVIFVMGLSKKLILADGISPYVDRAFAPDVQLSAFDYLLAIYGFSVQIYSDFSGYTDMAIGLAYLLRIRLPRNFRAPYTSRSIVEFWHRWHITLSHWLRDYLYITLGGNRRGFARQLLNLMITMLLGGLWHGANWTFVIWGGLHGLGIGFDHLVRRIWPKFRLSTWLGRVFTFHFVTLAWIYFRAPDLAMAHSVLTKAFTGSTSGLGAFLSDHAYVLILMLAFFATHRWDNHARVRLVLKRASKPVVWATVLVIAMLSIALSQGSSAKFIYFDF